MEENMIAWQQYFCIICENCMVAYVWETMWFYNKTFW